MRSILALLILFFFSCKSENNHIELYFSNNYKFARECELSVGRLIIPNLFELSQSEYGVLYSINYFVNSSVTLQVRYDCNSADQKMTEYNLGISNQVNTLESLYSIEKNIVSGLLSPKIYTYSFPIASGYCYLIFEFKDDISDRECEELFNSYIDQIKSFSNTNKPIITSSINSTTPKIHLKTANSKFSKVGIYGDLVIDKNTNSILYLSYIPLDFEDCPQLIGYFNEIIDPYYKDLADGTLMTILEHDSFEESINSDNIILQTMVRNNFNSFKHPSYLDKLSPMFLSENVNIKNKKYAVEQ